MAAVAVSSIFRPRATAAAGLPRRRTSSPLFDEFLAHHGHRHASTWFIRQARQPSQSLKHARDQPIPRQIRQLAHSIRLQFLTLHKAYDTLFNLRQLHMFQPPDFHPPKDSSPRYERWLWRYPAATAVHAIIREAEVDTDPDSRDRLLRSALQLTRNAFRWDAVCSTMTNPSSAPTEWQLVHEQSTTDILTSGSLSTPSADLRIVNSLKSVTVAYLFRSLVAAAMKMEALELACSAHSLGYQLSPEMLRECVSLALTVAKRKDVAIDYFVTLALSQPITSHLVESAWQNLHPAFSARATWAAKSSQLVVRCADKLLSTLDRLMLKRSAIDLGSDEQWRCDTAILSALASFGHRVDLQQTSLSVQQASVMRDIREFFSNLLSRHLPMSVKIDENKIECNKQDVPVAKEQQISLSARELVLLLQFAMRHEENAELAQAIIARLLAIEQRISPAALIAVLPVISRNAEEAIELSQLSPDERTLPALVEALHRMRAYDYVDRIVFSALPELNLPSSASRRTTVRRPALGRSRNLYMSLLKFACAAQRTGLAERIFKQMRWAAELSTSSLAQSRGIEPWSVPPASFTMMLRLYANEVRIGQEERGRFERGGRVRAGGRSYTVKGWARDAIRAHASRLRAQALTLETGGSALPESIVGSTTATADEGRPMSESEVRNMRLDRDAVAAIAAQHLLRDTNKRPEEMRNYERALRSEYSARAVEQLFGVAPTDELLEKWRKRRLKKMVRRKPLSGSKLESL